MSGPPSDHRTVRLSCCSTQVSGAFLRLCWGAGRHCQWRGAGRTQRAGRTTQGTRGPRPQPASSRQPGSGRRGAWGHAPNAASPSSQDPAAVSSPSPATLAKAFETSSLIPPPPGSGVPHSPDHSLGPSLPLGLWSRAQPAVGSSLHTGAISSRSPSCSQKSKLKYLGADRLVLRHLSGGCLMSKDNSRRNRFLAQILTKAPAPWAGSRHCGEANRQL